MALNIDLDFAEGLRRTRITRGLTQAQAAEQIGISVQGLGLAEGGRAGFKLRAKISAWIQNEKPKRQARRKVRRSRARAR